MRFCPVRAWRIGFAGAISLVMAGCASSRDLNPPLAQAPLVLGNVALDPVARTLVVSGFVNQVEGGIELLACGPGGKTHESVFVLFARAQDIQTGLLLLGLRPGPPMAGLGMGPPEGDRVMIEVVWEVDGKTRRARAEEFVRDRMTGEGVKPGSWTFNGSKVENGSFMAQAEESFIATYWDPWAIINIHDEAGEDDERLLVNRKTVPPLHTPVRMVIRAAKPGESR